MFLRAILPALLLCAALSCNGKPKPAPQRDEAAFGQVSMRLHPVFSRIKDWTGDGEPDGIEAMVEFQDAFGDPTKASGRLIFELFEFRPNQPEPRGRRVTNPWVGSLQTQDDQRERWNRASRTYTFPLELPKIDTGRDYVLTAQFDATDGKRFFDKLILQARRTRPTTDSSTGESNGG